MNSELQREIKAKGLFATCSQMMQAARAALPQSFGLCDRNLTAGSKLTPGITVDKNNRPTRILNSDPSIHRNSRPIERPLVVATADADLDESEEISVDDATELLPPAVVIIAGEEDPEQEQSDEELDTDIPTSEDGTNGDQELGAE